MLITIVFWLLILIDLAALGLVFLLGLAAGPSSHTGPLAIAAFLLVIPGILIAAAIGLFHFTKSKVLRTVAFLAAAAPLLFAVLAPVYAAYEMKQFQDKDGNMTFFKPGPMQEIEAAIVRNDAAAIAAIAPRADLKTAARDGSTVLVVAIRYLEKNPGPPDVLRALLKAGADPNAKQLELPLTVAIMASSKAGIEPARLLLEAGANPNTKGEFGDPVWFLATGIATDPGLLPLMLDHGADLRATSDRSHATALLDAVNSQNWAAVKVLLDRGIDWNSFRDPQGRDLLSRLKNDAGYSWSKKEGLDELIRRLQ